MAQRKRFPLTFQQAYELDPLQRVAVIKKGLPAASVPRVAQTMGITKEDLYRQLGFAPSTVDRKVRAKKSLSTEEGSRMLGALRLVGLAQVMVEESGGSAHNAFDAARWVASWLEQPLPALGWRRPAELMDTSEGQRIVENLLARAQSGAFA